MEFRANGERVGDVEQVEWKSERHDGGKVTFMAPFEFDWSGAGESYLVLVEEADSEETRYMIQRIQRADQGGGGCFVVAEVKVL